MSLGVRLSETCIESHQLIGWWCGCRPQRSYVVSLYWRTRHLLLRFLCLQEAAILALLIAILLARFKSIFLDSSSFSSSEGNSTLRPLSRVTLGTLCQRRHAEGKVSKSWIPKSQTWGTPSLLSRTRVKKKNPSSGQLKARHHRLAHESMALGVKVSESDSLNWEETSTLDTMNS